MRARTLLANGTLADHDAGRGLAERCYEAARGDGWIALDLAVTERARLDAAAAAAAAERAF